MSYEIRDTGYEIRSTEYEVLRTAYCVSDGDENFPRIYRLRDIHFPA